MPFVTGTVYVSILYVIAVNKKIQDIVMFILFFNHWKFEQEI